MIGVPCEGLFPKLEYQNRILKHLKTISRELSVKFHGEELTKELFVEYRVKTIHFNTRSIASLASSMYIYMDLSKKLMFL